MGEKRIICMDHAATTCTRKEVVDAMLPCFTDCCGNPSSIYGIARESKKGPDAARAQVAKAIGSDPDEIYFTSGAPPRMQVSVMRRSANIDPVQRYNMVKVQDAI